MSTLIQKKICMLGDFSTGKSSLVRRFVFNLFEDRYLSTIGVTISRKDIHMAGDVLMRLVLWDMSGSEKFNGTRTSYLQGSAGALLVCDLTRPETLTNLARYYQQLKETTPHATVVLVGNKVDLVAADSEMIRNMAIAALNFKTAYTITSAKTGESVEDTFNKLADQIIQGMNG